MTLSSATAASHRYFPTTSPVRRQDGKKPTGYVLYQDTERVVIVTGVDSDSSNSKTGGMLQVWILAAAVNPIEAIRQRMDTLVCGHCAHRGEINPLTGKVTHRSCYVRLDTAPLGIWRGWRNGIYPYLPKSRYADVFAGRQVRWGAYGDPFFIPVEVIRHASWLADGHTGYTHQWFQPEAQVLKSHLMASVDNDAEFARAAAMGWRTFRVRSKGAAPISNEVICPASIEATAARVDRYTARMRSASFEGPMPSCHISCEQCMLCDGAAGKSRKSVLIQAHGAGKSAFTLVQIAAV